MKKIKTKAMLFNECSNVAQKRGGRCLSKEYVNAKSKLEWECQEGHKWLASPTNIKSGKWCPKCGGRQSYKIEDLKRFARTKGGRCLSIKYFPGRLKHQWECANGHKWYARWSHIQNSGSWCPYCAGMVGDFLGQAKSLARDRGGRLVTTKYEKSSKKMVWECAQAHRFHLNLNNAKSGQWCPTCSSGISERICRAYFEALTGARFPKARPNWLKNQFGEGLELDGYSARLRLAFEHQGNQHYETLDFFHKGNRSAFLKQKKNDLEKAICCKKRGIRLIQIPQIGKAIKLKDLQGFIVSKVKSIDSELLVPRAEHIAVSVSEAYSSSNDKIHFDRLREIAKRAGGLLVSRVYLGDTSKLEWKCKLGHRWLASPTSIKQRKWCPKCGVIKRAESRLARTTLEDLQQMAIKRGGKLLSASYAGTLKKHRWRCDKRHIWEAVPDSIKRGTWCPICAGKNRTIQELRGIAKKNGGKLLSEDFNGLKAKYLWQCKKRHSWWARGGNVLGRGQWCPKCGREKQIQSRLSRTSVEILMELAKKKGGQFLSKNYRGTHHKHKWRCSVGHNWEAVPSSVKQGSWCPKCAIKRRQISKTKI